MADEPSHSLGSSLVCLAQTGDNLGGEAGQNTLRDHGEKGDHGQAMGKGNGTPKFFSLHQTLSQHQGWVKQIQPC